MMIIKRRLLWSQKALSHKDELRLVFLVFIFISGYGRLAHLFLFRFTPTKFHNHPLEMR